jgi:type II secretory pathway predicted ATPase ExeA
MILKYFGFSKEPFGSSPDPSSLYAGPAHREALASLKYGFASGRGFTALIAPPGMGKTTLLFRFLEDIRKSSGSAFLFDIDHQCEPREILAYVLRDIGITPAAGAAEIHAQLNGFLLQEVRAGRKFVLVIDEAQNLSEEALERVRLLSNFETPRTKVMHIVLAGQPQLAEKLMQPSLEQLRQRISTICRLQPLSSQETHDYIKHRLDMAGYLGDPLFTREALDLITEASQGIPRTINNLCFNALSLCCALRRKQVDGAMAAEAVSDQQLILDSQQVAIASDPAQFAGREPAVRRRKAGPGWLWVPALSVLLIILGFTAFKLPLPFSPWFHNTWLDNSVDMLLPDRNARSAQPPLSVPVMAVTPPPTVILPAPTPAPIAIKVEPNQTLTSIALEHFGSTDSQLLQRIKTLNPNLIDPDHILAGQTIWLPGTTALQVASATTQRTRGISHEP